MKLPKYKIRFLVIFAIPFGMLIITLGIIQDSISIPKTYENENKNPITEVNPKDTSFKEISINSFHFRPFSLNQHLYYELDILIIGKSLNDINISNEENEITIARNVDSIITIYWELYEYNRRIMIGTSKYQAYQCEFNHSIDTQFKKPLYYKYYNPGDYYLQKTFGQFSLSSLWSYKLRYKVLSNNDKCNENKYFLQFGIARGEYSGIGARGMNFMAPAFIMFAIMIFFATLFIASLLYVYLHNRSLKKEIENEYNQTHPNPTIQEL